MPKKTKASATSANASSAPSASNLDRKSTIKIPPQKGTTVGKKIDFSGVNNFDPAPAGTYESEFTKYEFKTSAKGNEYISGMFTIREETAEDGTVVEGKNVFHNWSLLPQSLWAFKRDAVAMGVDEEAFDEDTDVDAVLQDMVGRHALITVTVEDFVKEDGSHRLSNRITDGGIQATSVAGSALSARR